MMASTHVGTTLSTSAAVSAAVVGIGHLAGAETPELVMYSVVFMFAGIEGALLPDVDHENSFVSRVAPGFNIFYWTKVRDYFHTFVAAFVAGLPFFLLSIVSAYAHGHNKWMVYAGGKDYLTVILIAYGLGVIYGYVLHLIEDGFTPMGIMYLYPYKKTYYRIGGLQITEGSPQEKAFKWTVNCCALVLAFALLFLLL